MRIRDGVIDEVMLNEACSSGCGSFLETFAASLECDIRDFAQQALFALTGGSRKPLHGVHELQGAAGAKEGAVLGGISAGLSYSVVKMRC
jgi:activator of 2-hydroxyglutaryl-CoA dehydratase